MLKDRRNEKTEQLIKKTFLDLLKKKNINEIRVSEISRLANLGRGTFYLHYSNIYELYENIEQDVILNIKNIFNSAFPTTNPTNSKKLIMSLIEYIVNNKELFKILVHSDPGNTMYKIRKSFYNDVFNENTIINPTMNSDYNKSESIFVVSGITGVLEKWIIDNFKIESGVIADILNTIILKINKN